MAVTEDDRVDLFTHRPYDRLHEHHPRGPLPDVLPGALRGRVEEDEEKQPDADPQGPRRVCGTTSS